MQLQAEGGHLVCSAWLRLPSLPGKLVLMLLYMHNQSDNTIIICFLTLSKKCEVQKRGKTVWYNRIYRNRWKCDMWDINKLKYIYKNTKQRTSQYEDIIFPRLFKRLSIIIFFLNQSIIVYNKLYCLLSICIMFTSSLNRTSNVKTTSSFHLWRNNLLARTINKEIDWCSYKEGSEITPRMQSCLEPSPFSVKIISPVPVKFTACPFKTMFYQWLNHLIILKLI